MKRLTDFLWWVLFAALLVFTLWAFTDVSRGQTLSWNPNERAFGYFVFHGRASGRYDSTNYTAETSMRFDLAPGAHFFAVSAVGDGEESALSDELPYTVPALRVILEESCDVAGPWEGTTNILIVPLQAGRFYRSRLEVQP